MITRLLAWLGAGLALAVLAVLTGLQQASTPTTPPDSGEEEEEMTPADHVREASNRFYAALNTVLKGNDSVMYGVWSQGQDVTCLTPYGASRIGWERIREHYARLSELQPGGRVVPMETTVRVWDDVAWTIVMEKGMSYMAPGKPIRRNLRATNVFRLERGRWKLMHRHVDVEPMLGQALDLREKSGKPAAPSGR